nr:NADH:flavin oxidoreductase [Chromobacterium sp. Beijing]
MSYPHLFEPITLNRLTLRNRIVSTAHAEVYAEAGGLPGERYIRYYEEKAKGGLALAICGGSSPVSIDSPQGWWKSVNLASDAVIEPLARLAEAMHRHGAKIMIQATHMGRRSSYQGEHWPHLLSPSGVREPVHRGNAKIMETEDIHRVIADFALAARRVKAAGLDGIEIAAAHQHLIDQFWSPRTNQREDEWGGSLDNRLRFGMEVLQAVRAEVGADFCVGLRMSGDEFHEDGLSHDMLKEIAAAMSETGLIDYLSVIGSGADTHNSLANCMPPMALPPEPFVHLAAGIKSVSKVPVMHAQSIRDPVQAERILAAGMVDMVGMTRAHMADPHLVIKIRDGKEDQIRQCVGANYCIDRQYYGQDVLCIQNAATSRESTMPHLISRAARPRRVAVVGAGPAGLEAARVARERGHEVVLFERQPQVGGQILLAARAPQREQMAGIVRWLDMETQRLGVDRRLGAAADRSMIMDERPDIVVLATGGRPHTGQVPAWGVAEGLAVSSWDILSGQVEPARNVLVYDALSTHAGFGVADYLASRGSTVEIVTPDVKVGDDTGGTTFPIFYRRLYAQGIIPTPMSGWRRFTPKATRKSPCCATNTPKRWKSGRWTRW